MRPQFKHQTAGVEWILEHPRALLADEMRLGKSRQAIDAAQELWLRGEIDAALVIAPGEVARSVWGSQETGQIAEYTYVPTQLDIIRAVKSRTWVSGDPEARRQLWWIVTNYELMRRKNRLADLMKIVTPRTMLILDESSAVNSPSSAQTNACMELAKVCQRVLLLNGTPHGDNPGHLFSPFNILDPKIIGCANHYSFLAQFAIMGGFRKLRNIRTENGWSRRLEPVQIVSWTNLDTLYDRTKPYVLRRTLDEVFDLPPALDPIVIEVPLDNKSWATYRAMRDEALLRLEDGLVEAAQAGVLVMRLAQITSGFVGGIEALDPVVLGDEKLRAVLGWHELRLREDPNFRVIFWCRFRLEAERLAKALGNFVETRLLYGGQSHKERAEALALVGHGCSDRAAALVGIARTGGLGLDLSGASTTCYVSNEYSLMVRQQSAARTLGPNQRHPCAYFDFIATGPGGQKTIDHAVIKALRSKEDLAGWGGARWAAELRDETL